MKKFLRFLPMLMLAGIITACGSGSDEPEPTPTPDPVPGPDEEVADPAGTVKVTLRNTQSGGNYLDNIYINKGDNFAGGSFASFGQVHGLGNVASIPKIGYADAVSVVPGEGYVAYSGGRFYRLFVTDYTYNTLMEIIGAEVKYQKPFLGLDEALTPDMPSVTVDSEGGLVEVRFSNTTIIPFEVECDQPWLSVQPASTLDYYFLKDALSLYIEPTSGAETETANVTVTTGHGKQTVIPVTRSGCEPFVKVNDSFITVKQRGTETETGISANVDISKLTATVDKSWCHVEIVDLSGAYAAARATAPLRFAGDKPVTASRASARDANIHSYALKVSADENCESSPREAAVTIKAQGSSEAAVVSVSQEQAAIRFNSDTSSDDFLIEASYEANTSKVWLKRGYEEDVTPGEIEVTSDVDWLTAEEKKDMANSGEVADRYIAVSFTSNPELDAREGRVTVKAKGSTLKRDIVVSQKAASISLSGPEKIPNTGGTYNVSLSGSYDWSLVFEASSDADWVTLEKRGTSNSWDITYLANPTDRSRQATITVKATTGNLSTSCDVIQDAGTLVIDGKDEDFTFEFDRNSHTKTYNVTTTLDTKAECSADWVTVYLSGDNRTLNMTLQEASVNREAVITFSNCDRKITIRQSRYATGDEFNEDGLDGRVDFENGLIWKLADETNYYQWSTVYTVTGATSFVDGMANTEIIHSIPDWQETFPAFAVVDQLNTSGVTGWYMPACYELSGVGVTYWTSTEYGSYSAYFYNGSYVHDSKQYDVTVVAAHKVDLFKIR